MSSIYTYHPRLHQYTSTRPCKSPPPRNGYSTGKEVVIITLFHNDFKSKDAKKNVELTYFESFDLKKIVFKIETIK